MADNRGKMIGYYGNGMPKYENDDAIYAKKGYSPSHNPNPFGTVNFAQRNADTFRANNGAYPDSPTRYR